MRCENESKSKARLRSTSHDITPFSGRSSSTSNIGPPPKLTRRSCNLLDLISHMACIGRCDLQSLMRGPRPCAVPVGRPSINGCVVSSSDRRQTKKRGSARTDGWEPRAASCRFGNSVIFEPELLAHSWHLSNSRNFDIERNSDKLQICIGNPKFRQTRLLECKSVVMVFDQPLYEKRWPNTRRSRSFLQGLLLH